MTKAQTLRVKISEAMASGKNYSHLTEELIALMDRQKEANEKRAATLAEKKAAAKRRAEGCKKQVKSRMENFVPKQDKVIPDIICPRCSGKKSVSGTICLTCHRSDQKVLSDASAIRNEQKKLELKALRKKIKENGWQTSFRVSNRGDLLDRGYCQGGAPGTGKR